MQYVCQQFTCISLWSPCHFVLIYMYVCRPLRIRAAICVFTRSITFSTWSNACGTIPIAHLNLHLIEQVSSVFSSCCYLSVYILAFTSVREQVSRTNMFNLTLHHDKSSFQLVLLQLCHGFPLVWQIWWLRQSFWVFYGCLLLFFYVAWTIPDAIALLACTCTQHPSAHIIGK